MDSDKVQQAKVIAKKIRKERRPTEAVTDGQLKVLSEVHLWMNGLVLGQAEAKKEAKATTEDNPPVAAPEDLGPVEPKMDEDL